MSLVIVNNEIYSAVCSCCCFGVCLHAPKWCNDSAVWMFTWLVPRETAAVLAQALCTPYISAPVYSVTSFKATQGKVHVCLAVTCHLHFVDLLRATAVTLGWNGYRSNSHRREFTQEKKKRGKKKRRKNPAAPARIRTREL